MDDLQNVILQAQRDNIRAKNEDKYRDNSKKRLISIIEKKFKTTMIGSLATFEETFGYLWGHGEQSLSEEQAEFRRMWDEVRTEILNKGNNQLRAAQDEIASYTMTWDKYKTDFIIKQREH